MGTRPLAGKLPLLHALEDVLSSGLLQRVFSVDSLELLFEFAKLALGLSPPSLCGLLLVPAGGEGVSELLLLALQDGQLGLENCRLGCMCRNPG